MPANPVTTETVVVGPKGGLKWVVVYLSDGLDAGPASQVPSETPTWDQKGCQYIPHVMALDVNQHFKVSNSDPTRTTSIPCRHQMGRIMSGTSRSRRELRRSTKSGPARKSRFRSSATSIPGCMATWRW